MRVIAVIDDPHVLEKILRHLGLWHDPPARPSPVGHSGPYTHQPCDDVASMPDSPVDTTAGVCEGRAMLGEPEKQFSLTRAALSTCGRAKSKSVK